MTLSEFTFEDLDRRLLGVVFLVVGAAVVAATFAATSLGVLDDTYTVVATFDDVTGLNSGARVTVAGIDVGEVSAVTPDFERGLVEVALELDGGLELGPDTRARLGATTIFGGQEIRLEGPVVEPLLADGDRIPLDRTSRSPGVVEAIDSATQTAQEIDGGLLDESAAVLAEVAAANRGQLDGLFGNLETVAGALASRDAELERLLGGAQRVTATLSAKDQQLLQLIDSAGILLDELAAREDELRRLLGEGTEGVEALHRFVALNRQQLQEVVDDVGVIATGIGDQLDDLDRTLAWIGPTFQGLAVTGNDGPWINFFAETVGPEGEP